MLICWWNCLSRLNIATTNKNTTATTQHNTVGNTKYKKRVTYYGPFFRHSPGIQSILCAAPTCSLLLHVLGLIVSPRNTGLAVSISTQTDPFTDPNTPVVLVVQKYFFRPMIVKYPCLCFFLIKPSVLPSHNIPFRSLGRKRLPPWYATVEVYTKVDQHKTRAASETIVRLRKRNKISTQTIL